MPSSDYYRLEYNEKTGYFKYDSYLKRKENIFGWETIAMVINLEDVQAFIESVQKTYPLVNTGQGETFPKTDVIRKIFNSFSGISEL
jgi:hypothetical protein